MSLSGKVFAITGTLSLPRQQIQDWITARGGVVLPGITKKVTHLIVSDPGLTTGKIQKARESGTAIIGEDDLKKMDAGTAKVPAPAKVPAKATAKAPVKPKKPVEPEKELEPVANAPGGKGPLSGIVIALTGRLSKTKEE